MNIKGIFTIVFLEGAALYGLTEDLQRELKCVQKDFAQLTRPVTEENLEKIQANIKNCKQKLQSYLNCHGFDQKADDGILEMSLYSQCLTECADFYLGNEDFDSEGVRKWLCGPYTIAQHLAKQPNKITKD